MNPILVGAICVLIACCNLRNGAEMPGDTPGSNGVESRARAVCERLRDFGCPEGLPSKKGIACETTYIRDASAIDGYCIVHAASAVELRETCNVTCVNSDAASEVF